MRILISLIAGSLFGAGLLISGMTDTTKVQGWLDVFGNWDPTLAHIQLAHVSNAKFHPFRKPILLFSGFMFINSALGWAFE